MIIDLSDFEIYRSPGPDRNEYEFVPLHQLDVKTRDLSLNGFLSLGSIRHYIELVSIEDFSIEGYDNEEDPNIVAYIQSRIASKDRCFDIWYRLSTRPAPSYRPFWDAFVWVATFGKHVIDYLSSKPESMIGLSSFRNEFFAWLSRRYTGDPGFKSWSAQSTKIDFRSDINAYIDYLYNQANNLPNATTLLTHPVWADCLRGEITNIKEQPILCQKTIATPLVYDCFQKMYFGKFLKRMEPSDLVEREQNHRKRALGFVLSSHYHQKLKMSNAVKEDDEISRILKVGDIVGVKRDQEGRWKTLDDEWLAYVQRVEPYSSGAQRLYVLWLYRPTDTTISTMKYPIEKEMFFSDNCNCTESSLLSTDITRTYTIDWHPKGLQTDKDILIRQTYVTRESAFVTLRDSHLRCRCQIPKTKTKLSCRPGDCVYISRRCGGVTRLEPAIICRLTEETRDVGVRRLVRLTELNGKVCNYPSQYSAAPNELVISDEIYTVSTQRVQRKCHLRFFSTNVISSKLVPVPYNRGGNGDFWFFSSKLVNINGLPRLEHLSRPPDYIREGYDPRDIPAWQPLKALSIFSGGGNLDRGLEEGGAVDFVTAIDISKEAVHTQRANTPESKDLKVYWGSVDDYLKALLSGMKIEPLVRIGDIQLIAAGSPCPGFSKMQPNWKSDESLRNASHISTLCSYVDILRPEYAILENVVSMAHTRKGHEEEKVFSQVIACFVALGYQVSQHLMDSWSYGSCQRRSRLFITLAAPYLEPIPQPWLSHSHPENISARSLGTLANGEPFGCREDYPTPFRYVSAGESTEDLPGIGSGLSQTCPSFADHRVPYVMNRKDRALMKRIPTSPPGQGYADAMELGLIPSSVQKDKKNPGHSFRRIKPTLQFPTITTIVSPQDIRTGAVMHWREPRSISIAEAREAQSIPRHEVIIGLMAAQWRVIGNGVDRNVALALGLSLRRAWEQSFSLKRSIPGVETKLSGRTNGQQPSTTNMARKLASVTIQSKSVSLQIRGKRAREEDKSGTSSEDPIQIIMPERKKPRMAGQIADFATVAWDKIPEKTIKKA